MNDGMVSFIIIVAIFVLIICSMIFYHNGVKDQLKDDKEICNTMVQNKFGATPEKAAYECFYRWDK